MLPASWSKLFGIVSGEKMFKNLSTRIFTHLPLLVRPLYASVNWVIIGSGNSLLPVRHQAITWTNACLLPIGLPGTSFSEI